VSSSIGTTPRTGSVAAETAERIELPGGALAYTLRRSRRARRLRLVVDPVRGVVVTVPAGRPGAREAAAHVEPFLREREAWIRRHLAHQARARSAVAGSGPETLVDGARLRVRGVVHTLRLEPAPPDVRQSTVLTGWSAVAPDGAHLPAWGVREIVVRVSPLDRRPLAAVLEAWLRERAAIDIESAIGRHARALGVDPVRVSIRDPRTRWGSAARTGRLAFSWRLVLAPPEALETVVVHELAHLRVFGHGPAFWAVVSARVPDHQAWRRWLREHSVELHAALSDGPPT
jgi:hypothetical protein